MYNQIFSERIKQIRKEAGYTQLEVTENTGIPQSTISKIENGEIEPSLETIGKLSEFYSVSLDWLFGATKKFK